MAAFDFTTFKFKPVTPQIGLPSFDDTSTTQKLPLGTKCRFVDPTYGECELIYLAGVANTAAGDLVQYDLKAGTTTRAVHASKGGPAAVAMSANVGSQYGWYMVHGVVAVNVAGAVLADKPPYMTGTAGAVDDAIVAGDEVLGAHFKTVDTGGAGGYAWMQISYPSTPLALTMV